MILNHDSLSDSSQCLLVAATQLALHYQCEFTGTKHVVMAMCLNLDFLTNGCGNLEFDQEQVYNDLELTIPRQVQNPTPGGNANRYDTNLLDSLKLAAITNREKFGNQPEIEPYHILLGILREGNSVTANILKDHGVTYEGALAAFNGVSSATATKADEFLTNPS